MNLKEYVRSHQESIASAQERAEDSEMIRQEQIERERELESQAEKRRMRREKNLLEKRAYTVYKGNWEDVPRLAVFLLAETFKVRLDDFEYKVFRSPSTTGGWHGNVLLNCVDVSLPDVEPKRYPRDGYNHYVKSFYYFNEWGITLPKGLIADMWRYMELL